MNYIKSKGWMEDRVYISQNPIESLNQAIFQNTIEQKGAGVRCYSSIIGAILKQLGFATQIKLQGKSFYLNKQSLCKFMIRSAHLQNPSSAEKTARELHNLYIRFQKSGYHTQQLKSVSAHLESLHQAHQMDILAIYKSLHKVALDAKVPTQKQAVPDSKPSDNKHLDALKNRKYPPISKFDTVKLDHNNQVVSVHGEGLLFQDDEILMVHPVVKKTLIGAGSSPKSHPTPLLDNLFGIQNPDVYVEYSQYGKAIIQQQAVRGCTAAAAAMLIVDWGGKCDVQALISRNLGNDTDIDADIRKAGLTPKFTNIKNLSELQKAIQKNGPAIVSISGECGSHVIVVDEIKNDIVRLRDPYHGWEISVTAEALRKRFHGDDIIQIPVGL